MALTDGRSRLILALPGIVGCAFAILIGCLVLAFAYPSMGRQADYGYALSPAAGAMLFILLGLVPLAVRAGIVS